jgi:hypothetical protein
MNKLLIFTTVHADENWDLLHMVFSCSAGGHNAGISGRFLLGHGDILTVQEVIPGGVHLFRGWPKVLRFVRIQHTKHIIFSCVVADPSSEITLLKLDHLTSIVCQGMSVCYYYMSYSRGLILPKSVEKPVLKASPAWLIPNEGSVNGRSS